MRSDAELRDINIDVLKTDERAIEVLVSGLHMNHGVHLAVDITLSSAVTVCGRPCPNAASEDGAVLARARVDKERKYAELLVDDSCQLVVVGVETGGSWSREAENFIEHLASSRACEAPPALRFSASVAWKCFRILSVSWGRAFANSVVSSRDDTMAGIDGASLDLADLFTAEQVLVPSVLS